MTFRMEQGDTIKQTMNTRQVSESDFSIPSFCANDPVFNGKYHTAKPTSFALPDQHDLNTFLQDPVSAPNHDRMALLIIGLSPCEGDKQNLDDQTLHIATQNAGARLVHYVSRCNAHTSPGCSQDNSQEYNTSSTTRLFQLTTLQYAIVTDAQGKMLPALCESIISSLTPPVSVRNVPVSTAPHIGIALAQKHGNRPQALIRAARSALFQSKHNRNFSIQPC